jgi:CMP-N-acetylneuraminic acid synthetase
MDYGVAAARLSKRISRLVCSTDSDRIAQRCGELGVEVHPRPHELGGDLTPLFDVITHFVEDVGSREGSVAEFIALIQPTSPFLLPGHVDRCLEGFGQTPEAASAQTVIHCPHNHHAYNQRVVRDGWVAFRFPDERRRAYSKQTKPVHYLFGNVVVFRTTEALKQGIVFAEPSLAFEIPTPYGFDCDGPEDLVLGEAMLRAGIVRLPHLDDWQPHASAQCSEFVS